MNRSTEVEKQRFVEGGLRAVMGNETGRARRRKACPGTAGLRGVCGFKHSESGYARLFSSYVCRSWTAYMFGISYRADCPSN